MKVKIFTRSGITSLVALENDVNNWLEQVPPGTEILQRETIAAHSGSILRTIITIWFTSPRLRAERP